MIAAVSYKLPWFLDPMRPLYGAISSTSAWAAVRRLHEGTAQPMDQAIVDGYEDECRAKVPLSYLEDLGETGAAPSRIDRIRRLNKAYSVVVEKLRSLGESGAPRIDFYR